MAETYRLARALLLGFAVFLHGCGWFSPSVIDESAPITSSDIAFEDISPEAASGFQAKSESIARNYMVSTANPLATEAGLSILERGGSALDAAIAAQMVLTLVEPQSSGIGGGAFLLYWEEAEKRLRVYDGRETAPAAARPDMFLVNGAEPSYWEAVNSGVSVGVPGVLRALEMAHRRHGKLAWKELFQPAIDLARSGFAVTPRLHLMVSKSRGLADNADAARYFFDSDGQPWPVGHILTNPALARVLERIAADGADAFYSGSIALDIVSAVRNHAKRGELSLADMSDYQALERNPLCGPYRVYIVCGVPPPSSGGLGVLQLLGILEQFPVPEMKPGSLEAVHIFSEAGRLVFADRDYYVADPAFVPVPVQELLSPRYLQRRAQLIQPDQSMGVAEPGNPFGEEDILHGVDNALETPSTTHISIVDAQRNVVSMTSSVESAFGSKIMVHGFLLNNQLTDFSLSPVDDRGRPVANRVEPGKRPRSTMAPTMVFYEGRPLFAVGSPGGSAIMNYVAQALIGVLDWGLSPQEAVSQPHFGSRNKETELEAGTPLIRLVGPLEAMGHTVRVDHFTSGLQGIYITGQELIGAADPRREGTAEGR